MAVQGLPDPAADRLLTSVAEIRAMPAPLGQQADRLAALAQASAALRGTYLRELAQVEPATLVGERVATPAQLLIQAASVPPWQARRDAGLASRLGRLPGLLDALAEGRLSVESGLLLVKAWLALSSDFREAALADALIALAELVDHRELQAKVSELLGALQPTVSDVDLADARDDAVPSLVDLGARTRLTGDCDALSGEWLRQVLEAKVEADRVADDRRSPGRRLMEALLELVRAGAATDAVPGDPVLVTVTPLDDLLLLRELAEQETEGLGGDSPVPGSCGLADPTAVEADPALALADLFAGTDLLGASAHQGGCDDSGSGSGQGGSRRAADAFLDVLTRVRRARDRDNGPPRWGSRTRGGVPVGPRTLSTLLCHSVISRIVLDPLGHPLDSRPAVRQLDTHERRALEHRAGYRCERTGCDRGAGRCVPHHVIPWSLGGPSTLANTVLLCHACHHELHDRDRPLELTGNRRIGPRGWLPRPVGVAA